MRERNPETAVAGAAGKLEKKTARTAVNKPIRIKGADGEAFVLGSHEAGLSDGKKSARLRLVLRLAGLVVAGIVALKLATTPFLEIKSVEVRGPVETLGLQDVVSAVRESLKGNMLTANIERVKNAVEALPWIKSAEVTRLWLDTLHVDVVRHQAVAIFEDGRLVSNEGILFASNDEPIERLMAMPTFSGDPMYVGEAVRLLPLFEEQARRLSARIKAVEATFRGSWSVVVESPQFDAMTIELGRALTKNGPAVRLSQVVDNLERVSDMMQGYPERIDARYKDAFAAQIPTKDAHERWLAAHPDAEDVAKQDENDKNDKNKDRKKAKKENRPAGKKTDGGKKPG